MNKNYAMFIKKTFHLVETDILTLKLEVRNRIDKLEGLVVLQPAVVMKRAVRMRI